MEFIHAPKFEAEDLAWFNVPKPLEISDLKGKLVILDFWTFCCINCIHIIPTLKRLEESFPNHLVVIGVHSPKFPSEKNPDNVRQAIARYEIVHPVVHDPELRIWKQYAIRAWPTMVFIDPEGYILGQLSGEPDPDQMHATIEKLIDDMKTKGRLEGDAADLLETPLSGQSSILRFPAKIAYSEADREFAITDSNHNQIVTAGREGNITRRIGSGNIGHRDGTFEDVEFFRPQGLCYMNGIIWVADTENHRIRMIDLISGQVFTAAGTGNQGSFLKHEPTLGVQTAISSPWDVALHQGNLYFANAGTHQIGVYHIDDGKLSCFAGTGQEALVDGPRLKGAFAQPSGLSVGNGTLFLADSETSAIRGIHLNGGKVETYVGTGLFDFGDRDGQGKDAILQHPLGVHYSEGNLYIADSYNHKIRVIDLKTHTVSTLKASVDLVCDDASCSRLGEPAGVIAVESCLYVCDTNNHRVLKIDLKTGKTAVFIK